MKNIRLFFIEFTIIFLLLICCQIYSQSKWSKLKSGTFADLYDVYFLNNNKGFAVGDSGVFLQTKNGGATWSKQYLGNYLFRSVQFVDSTTGYIAGYGTSGGVFLKTIDAGNHWSITTGFGYSFCMHFVSKDIGIAAGFGHFIVKTTNGGQSWLDLSKGHGFNVSAFINNIICFNDSTVFLSSGDSTPGFPVSEQIDYLGQVSKTTDSGNTWNTFVTFSPNSSISFGNDSIGYACGMWGNIYRTTDIGMTWKGVSSNLSHNLIRGGVIWQLEFVSQDSGWVVISTDSTNKNGSILMTVDGGINWIIEDSETTGVLHKIFFSDKKYGWAVGANGTILFRSGITSVNKTNSLLKIFALYQNFPNPFNPTTNINYQLFKNDFVTLKVYDMLGREVASLVNENEQAGSYSVPFDASELSSGIYIYTIRANDFVKSKKMILLK